MNTSFIFLVVTLVFLALVASIWEVFHKAKVGKWPYLKREYFLTQAEKSFYTVLSQTVGNNYLLFSKVRMSDLLYLPKMSNRDYYRYQNKIQSKHVDFLLCDKENVRPLLAIELDDTSHLRTDRAQRDILVDDIFENAQLPILHIHTASSYNNEELSQQIQNSLNLYSLPLDDTSSVA